MPLTSHAPTTEIINWIMTLLLSFILGTVKNTFYILVDQLSQPLLNNLLIIIIMIDLYAIQDRVQNLQHLLL